MKLEKAMKQAKASVLLEIGNTEITEGTI